MENLEVTSGANFVEDGGSSGPVVNSQRQLWSVAGFIGAVVEGVFGLSVEGGVRRAAPILPGGEWFREGAVLTFGDFEARIGTERLPAGTITRMAGEDWRDLFGARVPTVTLEGAGELVTLQFQGEEGATFAVYKDGQRVEENATSPWSDRSAPTGCYSVVARLRLPSLPSQPLLVGTARAVFKVSTPRTLSPQVAFGRRSMGGGTTFGARRAHLNHGSYTQSYRGAFLQLVYATVPDQSRRGHRRCQKDHRTQ